MDELTLMTWNLQGSTGVDLDLVVGTIGSADADVVVVQEIQRRQCRRLARRLGWSARWCFKHWPIVSRPEGMAVLTPHQLGHVSPFVVQHAAWWSWRRRVALDATVLVGPRPWRVMNIHLSPHGVTDRRTREVERVLERAQLVAPLIAGDLNERPGGAVGRDLRRAGWRDAWATVHSGAGGDPAHPSDGPLTVDPGATNWTAGDRTGRPPTQRLDVVFVPADWMVDRADVIDRPLAALAAGSDHLPLVVRVSRGEPRP